jgi:ribonuclease P protein component
VLSERSLRSASDFRRVRSDGRRVVTEALTVYVARRPDERPARVGLAVGRACGGAVARNRIKRRLRAACRAAQPPAGVDLVVHGRAAAASSDFQEMLNTIARAINREVR